MLDYTQLNILYEDNHVIVVEKPSEILSQADGSLRQDMLTLIKEYIKEKYSKPGNVFLGLVHRLDFNVGGIMVFAKTSKAASRLSEAMRGQDFSKSYYAVVEADLQIGLVSTLEDYIEKDEYEKMARISDSKNGKLSKLNFEVIDKIMINNKVLSLVKVNLLTGRFHQIRVQFASRNMPLFGDTKYGHRVRNTDVELGLFSYQLSFPHPINQEILSFEILPTESIFLQFKYFRSKNQ